MANISKFSNPYKVLDDEENITPSKNQLRNKRKRLKEIERLESKPTEQLNEAQKRKIESKQQIIDDIEYIESCLNNKPDIEQSIPTNKNNKKNKKNKKKKKINPRQQKQIHLYSILLKSKVVFFN